MNVSTAAVFRSNGRIPFRLAMLLFAACAVATCGAASPVTPDQNQLDLLVQRLRAQNAQVSLGDAVPKSDTPYFSVTATRITVDAEQVFVFRYPTSEAAAADAAVVSPTGQPSPTVSIMGRQTAFLSSGPAHRAVRGVHGESPSDPGGSARTTIRGWSWTVSRLIGVGPDLVRNEDDRESLPASRHDGRALVCRDVHPDVRDGQQV